MNSFLVVLILAQAVTFALADYHELQRQYSLACKNELGANDEDFAILRSYDIPKNEIQSCLIDCLYTKLAIIVDGKFSDQGHQSVIESLAGNNKEKLAKMEELYQKCSKNVLVREKCPFGKTLRTCANTQYPDLVQSLKAAKKNS